MPPIVAQLTAQDPGPITDPAASTDCGEACLASAIWAVRGLAIAPGCLRQALRLPPDNGSTTPEELAQLWAAVGRVARVKRGTSQDMDPLGLTLRHDRRYRVMLGNWNGPNLAHWILAFHTDAGRVRCMDPATGSYVDKTPGEVSSQGLGAWVDLT